MNVSEDLQLSRTVNERPGFVFAIDQLCKEQRDIGRKMIGLVDQPSIKFYLFCRTEPIFFFLFLQFLIK